MEQGENTSAISTDASDWRSRFKKERMFHPSESCWSCMMHSFNMMSRCSIEQILLDKGSCHTGSMEQLKSVAVVVPQA